MELVINAFSDQSLDIFKAISIKSRLDILKLLGTDKEYSISEIADHLGHTSANVSQNVKKLEAANLLDVSYMPGNHGTKKMCRGVYDRFIVNFQPEEEKEKETDESISLKRKTNGGVL